MRLLVMGTGPFCVPTLRRLHESSHELAAVVTQPLRYTRGRPNETPMRLVALELGLPVLDPPDINADDVESTLRSLAAELYVVADYGQILSPRTLAIPSRGAVNLHGSLLPKYRGAAPINWALYHGETTAGVSVIHMTPRIDAGPCLAQAALTVGEDETAVELEPRLADLGAGLVREVVDRMAELPAGSALPSIPQDPLRATRAPRLKKEDGQIDWRRSAAAIRNQVRAMEPWPRAFTWWHAPDREPQRWILGPVRVAEPAVDAREAAPAPQPGAILAVDGERILVAAGPDEAGRPTAVEIRDLQPAGKRMLSAAEFLRGCRVQPGEQLGAESLE